MLTLLVWCNESIKPPFWLMAGVLLQLGGSTPHQGGRCQFIHPPDMEGYLPITPPFLVLWTRPSSVSSCVGHGVHCPMASMDSDVIPSAKCTCSFQCLHPLYITWSLHPSSVDALVDVHGRSCNFPLIYTREVLLSRHWVTTQPLLSCGIITSSFPLEVGLCGWDWYICSMHDRHLYTRECQPLM